MGCDNTKPTQTPLMEKYAAAGLQQPWSNEYENDFEKKIFMAINLFRHDPKHFVTIVKKVYKTHPLLKGSKSMEELVKKLQTAEPMTQVRFDGQANEACRQNNAEIVEKNEAVPTKGGNIEKYKTITGEEKASECFEYTMCKYEGSCAEEFIALELVLDWDREGEEGKKSPLLDKDVSMVGISNKAHKTTTNVIQILYIKGTVNALE